MLSATTNTRRCDLRGAVPEGLIEHLIYFAFPLAARRSLDAAAVLREAGNAAAAGHLDRKAQLFGEAQTFAVRREWPHVVAIIERLTDGERDLIQPLA